MRRHRQLQSTTVDQLQQSYHRNLLYRHLLDACRFARQSVLLRYIYANRKLLRLWHRKHKKECPFETTNWVWPVLVTNSSNFYRSEKVRRSDQMNTLRSIATAMTGAINREFINTSFRNHKYLITDTIHSIVILHPLFVILMRILIVNATLCSTWIVIKRRNISSLTSVRRRPIYHMKWKSFRQNRTNHCHCADDAIWYNSDGRVLAHS